MGGGARGDRLTGLLVMVVAFVLLVAATASAQHQVRVRMAPPPAWVHTSWKTEARPVEPTDGTSLLLLEFQERYEAGRRATFRRSEVRVDTEAGVREAGQQVFDFVPPHESLTVHRLEVRRGDGVVYAAKSTDFRILQREERMGEHVYDGRRTAVVVLPDLRVGDVIVTEYSRNGKNLVLEDLISGAWFQQQRFPIGSLRYRLISDEPIRFKAFRSAGTPIEERQGGAYVYTWEGADIPAARLEANMPTTYSPVPWLQYSNAEQWSKVESWASRLFRAPAVTSGSLRAVVDEIAATASTDEDRVRAVLRYVQDKVRYLALNFAESSHRPHPPSEVIENGYGDCKDKALLTVTLLRAMNVTARPALVSSVAGRGLSERLPSAGVFDHVIVAADIHGKRVFVDPTLLFQRGPLEDLGVFGFGYALVIGAKEGDLTPVVDPALKPISAAVDYHTSSFHGPVQVEVKTTYQGMVANVVRANRASMSAADFNERLLSTVREVHSNAKPVGEPGIVDWEDKNEVLIAQRYELDDPWMVDKDGVRSLVVVPLRVVGALPTIVPERMHPIAIEPRHVVQHTTITLTEPLPAEATHKVIENDAFRYELKADESNGQVVRVRHEFETKASEVSPDTFPAYRAGLSELDDNLRWGVSTWPPFQSDEHLPNATFLALALWVVILGAGLVFVHKRQPYLPRDNVAYAPSLVGRRGWLLLLGVGVTFQPFYLIGEFLTSSEVYFAPQWGALTNEASPSYNPAFVVALTFELFGNVTLFITACYLVYLFWEGRRSFPLMFLGFHGVVLAYSITDGILANDLGEAAGGPAPIVRSFFTITIWGSYVLLSRRVRSTFLPPPVT